MMRFVNVRCLVDKVSDATAALGRTVAPHIRRHSTKLLPASFTQPSSPGGTSKFDDACDIAASGLKGTFSLRGRQTTAHGPDPAGRRVLTGLRRFLNLCSRRPVKGVVYCLQIFYILSI